MTWFCGATPAGLPGTACRRSSSASSPASTGGLIRTVHGASETWGIRAYVALCDGEVQAGHEGLSLGSGEGARDAHATAARRQAIPGRSVRRAPA